MPLMPPVAVLAISMWVRLASSVYCFTWRVTVAQEMALRVIQPMPGRGLFMLEWLQLSGVCIYVCMSV